MQCHFTNSRRRRAGNALVWWPVEPMTALEAILRQRHGGTLHEGRRTASCSCVHDGGERMALRLHQQVTTLSGTPKAICQGHHMQHPCVHATIQGDCVTCLQHPATLCCPTPRCYATSEASLITCCRRGITRHCITCPCVPGPAIATKDTSSSRLTAAAANIIAGAASAAANTAGLLLQPVSEG